MWTNLILAILTSKPVKRLAAKVIEGGVKSTKTKFDDTLAEPVLKYLRS
jgi:hypothetical protein